MEAWKLSMLALQGLCSKCRFCLRVSKISIEGKERKLSCEIQVYDFMGFWFYDFTISCMFFLIYV